MIFLTMRFIWKFMNPDRAEPKPEPQTEPEPNLNLNLN